jgi:hypothetical protein
MSSKIINHEGYEGTRRENIFRKTGKIIGKKFFVNEFPS